MGKNLDRPVIIDSYTMGDVFNDLRAQGKLNRESNRASSPELLTQNNIPFKKFTDDHLRVGEYDFWPSTGLFMHIKTKKKNRGVFKLIKAVKNGEK